MKRTFQFLLFALSLLMLKSASASTWYVRADGGGLYSSARQAWGFPDKQIGCDGLADVSYTAAVASAHGATTNLHCAINDLRYLWDNQVDYNHLQWIIAGGDTVLLDNTQEWRVGWDTDGTQGNEPWCRGWDGGPYGCMNPAVPAGTTSAPTRILGRNYAACSTGSQPDPTKMTRLIGGHAIYGALDLSGTQHVQVECLEVTTHASCIVHGNPIPNGLACSKSFPLSDFDGTGIFTNNQTNDVLLQDLYIHGHTDRGIKGPIGGTITANRVDISVNGMAGWDFDDGNGTPNVNGVLKMSYSTIEWSGCNQIYPSTLPSYCYSQSTAGYGDGIGTPANDAMSVYIDHSIFRYNTQDGEDFGHIDTGSNTLQITNSASYANNGGQWKWGPNFTNVLLQNNLAVANCLRMSQPINGIPSTYNQYLGDFCRANDALSFNFRNGGTAAFVNNTIITYAPTTFDLTCWDSSCANSTFTLSNNIILGYQNPTTWNMGGQQGGVGGFCGAYCNGSTAQLGTMNRQNNIFYGIRGACIANSIQAAQRGSATGESCLDPQLNNEPSSFTSEATLDGFDFALTSSSPAKFGGALVSTLTQDYDNLTRNNPPSIGALEFHSVASLLNLQPWAAAVGISTPVTPVTPVSTPTPTPPATTTAPTGPANTQTQLTASRGPSNSAPLIVTAKVTALAGSKLPTGYVVLYNSSNVAIGKSLLNGTAQASWTVPTTYLSQPIRAVYSGTAAFVTSTSNTLLGTTALASLGK